MENIKAVIFDVDGLMLDTERLWINSVVKTNIMYGYNVSEDLIIDCIGCRNDVIESKLKYCLGQKFNAKKIS